MILSFGSMEIDKLSDNWKVNYLKKRQISKQSILKSINNTNAFIIYHYDR